MKAGWTLVIASLALAANVRAQSAVTPDLVAGVLRLRTAAAAEVRQLEADARTAERAWRARFVGALEGAGGAPLGEDEVLWAIRAAERTHGGLRRTIEAVLAERIADERSARTMLAGIVPVATEAVLERWRLRMEEARLAVDLIEQTYQRATAGARRLAAREAERPAAERREAEARALATREFQAAIEAVRSAHTRAVDDLLLWVGYLRQLDQAATADGVLQLVEARLGTSAEGDLGIRSELDRFLAERRLRFEPVAIDVSAQPLTMAGAVAHIEPGRLSGPSRLPTVRIFRAGPSGYEPAQELAFGRPHVIEVEFPVPSGPDDQEIALTWTEAGEARQLVVPINRRGGAVFWSDVLVVWPHVFSRR